MKVPFGKRLVINADDFGLLPEVNRAIMACFRAGSITSTTLMINTEGAADAVRLAKKNPDLGVGFHFNLTHGKPVSSPAEIPTLISDTGAFFPRAGFEKRVLLKRIRTRDVKREFKAQLDRFEEFDLEMTHMDSHHHIHMFPSIFKIVSDYAKEKVLPLRIPWVTYRFIRPTLKFQGLNAVLRKVLLQILTVMIPAGLCDQIVVPNRFLSVHDYGVLSGRLSPNNYIKLLTAAGPGLTEIMVHPSYNTSELRALYDDTYMREIELRTLTSFSLIEAAERKGIEVVSYRAYPETGN